MGQRWGTPRPSAQRKAQSAVGGAEESPAQEVVPERQMSQALPLAEGHSVLFHLFSPVRGQDTTLSLPKEPRLPHPGTGQCPREAKQVGSSQQPLRPQEGGESSPRRFPAGISSGTGSPFPTWPPSWGRKPQLLPLCIRAAGQEAGGDKKRSTVPFLPRQKFPRTGLESSGAEQC